MEVEKSKSEILYNGLIRYENENYYCVKCNREFNNKQSCITHVTMRKTDCRITDRVLYSCEICGKTFKDKTKYNIHFNSKKCNKVKIHLKIGNNKHKSQQSRFIDIFIDKYISDFWFNVFLKKSVEENNYENDIKKYLFSLDENQIHNLYSLLMRKIDAIGDDDICLFISNVKKIININEDIINKHIIIKWNSKLNEEVIKHISFD